MISRTPKNVRCTFASAIALSTLSTLATFAAGCAVGDGAQQEDTSVSTASASTAPTVPLYTWYSPSRGDYFTTSSSVWAPTATPDGTVAIKSPDYRFVAIEGSVFSPGAAQPRDTVPLYSWWSPSRGDNFITSNPSWAGRAGDTQSPDYTFVRVEGYAFAKPLAGTRALRSWYNAGPADNAASANPDWVPSANATRGGYGYVRDEGYILPVGERWDDRARAESFGFGHMKVNGRAALGRRPLLLLKATLPDSGIAFAHDTPYYENIVFGTAAQNVTDYFLEQSHQLFTWTRAGSVSVANEPGFANAADEKWLASMYSKAIAFDFARYDTNGDKKITSDELGIVVINNKSTNGGGARWMDGGCATPAGSTVAICVQSAVVGEDIDFASLVHEMTHTLGAQDLYDNTDLYNVHLTLMGATNWGTYHLDPWHKMQLGWVRPRIREIHDPANVEALVLPRLSGASGISDESPILIYDALKGQREYFLLEYRRPTTTAGGKYDADAYSQGLAAWWVGQDANRDSYIVDAPSGPPAIDRTVWLFAPNGQRGDTRLWTAGDGEFSLRWFDGIDVGVRVRVGAMNGDAPIYVQWRPVAQPFLPRIDSVATGSKTDALVVGGVFPLLSDGATVTASASFGAGTVTAVSWSPRRLDVSTGGLPYATYTLRVNVDPTWTQRSNGVDFLGGR